MMNVVLLDDDVSPWSMKFVRGAVERAIQHDAELTCCPNGKWNHNCTTVNE
jgi:hypothetical protein